MQCPEFEKRYPLPSGVAWCATRQDYMPARPSIIVYKATLDYRTLWHSWQNKGKPLSDPIPPAEVPRFSKCIILIGKP